MGVGHGDLNRGVKARPRRADAALRIDHDDRGEALDWKKTLRKTDADRARRRVNRNAARNARRRPPARRRRWVRRRPADAFARSVATSGVSKRHGSHHDAKKSKNTTRPRSSADVERAAIEFRVGDARRRIGLCQTERTRRQEDLPHHERDDAAARRYRTDGPTAGGAVAFPRRCYSAAKTAAMP